MNGEVVYLYAFDVAGEIVMPRVRTVLGLTPTPFAIRTEPTYPKDIPLYQPLAVKPPAGGATVRGQPVRLLVRVYSVGVVTVCARAPFAVEGLADLMPFHAPVLDDGRPLDRVASDLCARTCTDLAGAMIQSSAPTEPEAYTAFCVTEVPGVEDTARWLEQQRRPVAGLLAETDPARLSEAQVAEVLRLARSFETTDLVVADWDAALVVDLSGYVDDVLYVLELANLQLEEFHTMDRRLDRYLDRAYDDLERQPTWGFGGAGRVLDVLRRFRVDVTKLADEVTHIAKFLGDWYLARVYLAVSERFHLDEWRGSVERRLAQLDQLYSVVHSDVYERRMYWLEVIIVVLFVIDVVMLFWGGR